MSATNTFEADVTVTKPAKKEKPKLAWRKFDVTKLSANAKARHEALMTAYKAVAAATKGFRECVREEAHASEFADWSKKEIVFSFRYGPAYAIADKEMDKGDETADDLGALFAGK